MSLVEIIPHEQTNPELLGGVYEWIERRLGKNIVITRDTVNFIANRIGVFALLAQHYHGERLGLNPETVDALTGKLMGRPSSATYRTMDVVGLDTSFIVAKNIYDRVPDDPYREYFQAPQWIKDLCERGHLGQKSDSKGVYFKTRDERGRRQIQVYNLVTGDYGVQNIATPPWFAEASKIRDLFKRTEKILDFDDPGAQLVWKSWSDVFSYSALLLEEIAEGSPQKIDQAMRYGFQWQWGPFEVWQGLGFHKVARRMIEEGTSVPAWVESAVQDENFALYAPAPWDEAWSRGTDRQEYRPGHESRVGIPAPQHKIILPAFPSPTDSRWLKGNGAASLLDVGDDVSVLNFHTKMNSIGRDLLVMIGEAVEYIDQNKGRGLVVANDGRAFSAGADLGMLLELIEKDQFDDVDDVLRLFQGTMQALKFASFPVVSAPHGMTLGGGCEVTLHTAYRHVAGEAYVGLVEAGVGLIPAAGGTKELALRCYALAEHYQKDPMVFLEKVFMTVAEAQVSTSGPQAVTLGLYPEANTSFTLSRDHQCSEAKKIALGASELGYRRKKAKDGIAVAGYPGWETFKMMLYNLEKGDMISAHDSLVAEKLAWVLCGGDLERGTKVDESWFLDLERRAFVALCREVKTRERITHMLKTGKPLRN